MIPGLVPVPYYDRLAVTLLRGRYEDAVASSTAPRGLHVLAVRLTELVRWFDLQSADFFCLSDLQSAYQPAFGLYPLLFYKESALGFDCLFWLHQ